MLLFNIFNNRLDDIFNSSDKKNIISRHQNKKAASPQLLATKKDRVTDYFELEKQINNTKRDPSNINFLY